MRKMHRKDNQQNTYIKVRKAIIARNGPDFLDGINGESIILIVEFSLMFAIIFVLSCISTNFDIEPFTSAFVAELISL